MEVFERIRKFTKELFFQKTFSYFFLNPLQKWESANSAGGNGRVVQKIVPNDRIVY